jgi:hypothetical protein
MCALVRGFNSIRRNGPQGWFKGRANKISVYPRFPADDVRSGSTLPAAARPLRRMDAPAAGPGRCRSAPGSSAAPAVRRPAPELVRNCHSLRGTSEESTCPWQVDRSRSGSRPTHDPFSRSASAIRRGRAAPHRRGSADAAAALSGRCPWQVRLNRHIRSPPPLEARSDGSPDRVLWAPGARPRPGSHAPGPSRRFRCRAWAGPRTDAIGW